QQPGLVATIADALQRSGIDPHCLKLEITESAVMGDAAAAVRTLGGLKELGVQLAIDDFGTGYSSLAYLKQFPVDALKIDRSFIAGMGESKESRALIHTLIELGRALGLETLAEGIEDEHQLERLQDENCDSGQGFLVAPPLDGGAVAEFVVGWQTRAAAAAVLTA